MLIREESLHHYLRMMDAGYPFSFAGFSDAEWRCIFAWMKERAPGHWPWEDWRGTKTGLGQEITAAHGKLLAEVVLNRWDDGNFLFAVPKCLWPHEEKLRDGTRQHNAGLPGFAEGQVDWWCGQNGVVLTGWERDKALDDVAQRPGDLLPLIDRLRSMKCVLVGPRELERFACMELKAGFVPIASPNLHLDPHGIDRAVEGVNLLLRPRTAVVISAGMSAAVIIDRLHDRGDCWLLDVGSIWDAFAGIGGQRQWRAELYANRADWNNWKKWNLHGKPGRTM